MFIDSGPNLGANLYGCISRNSSVAMGGYPLPAATSSIGGVSGPASSELALNGNCALSPNFGESAHTVGGGNDSGIVNALQPASSILLANVTDLAHSATLDATNASEIIAGVLSPARLPGSVVHSSQIDTYLNRTMPAPPASGTSRCWTDAVNKNWECINDAGNVFSSVLASSAPINQFATGISTSGIISYAQPSFANVSGTIATSQLGGSLSGDLAGSLPNPSVAKLNGTSIPPNSNADQAIVTIGPAAASWASLPLCPDLGGQHLNYNTATHTFTCGTTGAQVNAAFSTLASGTNTNASMLVGSGSSLAPSGSGTITANTLQGAPIASTPPSSGQCLTFNGSSWVPGPCGAGNVPGVSATTTGMAAANNGVSPTWSRSTFDVSQFPGSSIDAALNSCIGTAIVAGGGVCDARALMTGTLYAEVDVGELVVPKLTGGSGGSLAYGTYKVVYTETANSRESTTSIEASITLNASNCGSSGSCSIVVTSPASYYGATVYTPYMTAGNSWTESRCAATALGTNAVLSTSCSGATISNSGTTVTLLIPSGGTWNIAMTDGVSCGIKSNNLSNIEAAGSTLNTGLILNVNSNANLRAAYCTDFNVPSGNSPYYFVRGIRAQNLSAARLATAVAEIYSADDGSTFQFLEAITRGGPGIWVRSACCGTSFYMANAGGGGYTGSQPLLIGDSAGTGVGPISFINSSINGADANHSNIQINSSLTGMVSFYNLYMESDVNTSGCTSPYIEVNGVTGPINFDGVHVGVLCPSNANYVIDIGAGTKGFSAKNINGDSYLINDHVNSIAISGISPTSLTVPEYAFGGTPSYFPSGVSLFTSGSQPACNAAREGTLWYTKGSGVANGSFQICQNQAGAYTWVSH